MNRKSNFRIKFSSQGKQPKVLDDKSNVLQLDITLCYGESMCTINP